ncbi:hypothetical protein Tco_1061314, partial [Tanacetum coccineum]
TRGDDEEVWTDEENSDLEDENLIKENKIAEIFRIETDIFDFETPLCEAFMEFNYLLKIEIDVLTNDIDMSLPLVLTPQLHESAGGLPSLKLSLHSCSLPGSTNAMGIETSIALVLPAREHECDTSFVLGRPPALS